MKQLNRTYSQEGTYSRKREKVKKSYPYAANLRKFAKFS